MKWVKNSNLMNEKQNLLWKSEKTFVSLIYKLSETVLFSEVKIN